MKHEAEGEKVMLKIETYKRQHLCQINEDDGGTITEWEEDYITEGFDYQIHSAKDIFQLNNDDVKLLRKDLQEDLR